MAELPSDTLYREELSSPWTEALFLVLMALSGLFSAWRAAVVGFDAWVVLFIFLAALFLFYSLNFRTLQILITPDSLWLRFGVFSWRVPLENIAGCRLDKLPFLVKYGGAGIHFMLVRKRYRASFNFLEYPRVVVSLKRKAGPVTDISFSTRHPDQLISLLPGMIETPAPSPLG